MGRFNKIRGLSDERRLPRLGYIRLGHKVKNKGGGSRCQCKGDQGCIYCTHPEETPHFVLRDAPGVAAVYGDTPTMLDVMVPLEAVEEVFPQALKCFKASGLWCEGNGEVAFRRSDDTGAWDKRTCPCDLLDAKNGCKKVGTLNVLLPKVNVGGVFHIVTSSWNSIVDVQSGLAFVRGMIGRLAWVPMQLRREPTPTTHRDPTTKKHFKQTHYTLKIGFEGDVDFVNRLRMESAHVLAGPKYVLPAPDRDPGRDMPDLIETTAVDVGADGSPIVEPGQEPVIQPDRMGKPEKPPKKPAAAKKPRKPRKPAKPASGVTGEPATPPAGKPATPPPGQPGDTPVGERPMSNNEITMLWEWVQRAHGVDGLDAARKFFGFFVNDYCEVRSSAEMPAKMFDMHLPELKRVAALPTDEEKLAAMEEIRTQLRVVIDYRTQAPAPT